MLEHLGESIGMADAHCGDCMFIGAEMGRSCGALDGRPLRADGKGPLRVVECIEDQLKTHAGETLCHKSVKAEEICGACKWLGHICTWYCGMHDAYLSVVSGQPVRCVDCLDESKDHKERND